MAWRLLLLLLDFCWRSDCIGIVGISVRYEWHRHFICSKTFRRVPVWTFTKWMSCQVKQRLRFAALNVGSAGGYSCNITFYETIMQCQSETACSRRSVLIPRPRDQLQTLIDICGWGEASEITVELAWRRRLVVRNPGSLACGNLALFACPSDSHASPSPCPVRPCIRARHTTMRLSLHHRNPQFALERPSPIARNG